MYICICIYGERVLGATHNAFSPMGWNGTGRVGMRATCCLAVWLSDVLFVCLFWSEPKKTRYAKHVWANGQGISIKNDPGLLIGRLQVIQKTGRHQINIWKPLFQHHYCCVINGKKKNFKFPHQLAGGPQRVKVICGNLITKISHLKLKCPPRGLDSFPLTSVRSWRKCISQRIQEHLRFSGLGFCFFFCFKLLFFRFFFVLGIFSSPHLVLTPTLGELWKSCVWNVSFEGNAQDPQSQGSQETVICA